MQNYEKIIELLKEQKYTQATALLSKFCVSYMDEQAFAQLEECLAQIPDEVKRKSGQLCFLQVSVELRRGRTRPARQWYSQLVALRDACKEGSRERAQLAQLICIAGMMMPQTDNAQLLLLLSVMHNEMVTYKVPPIQISLTMRRPSVLRGAKDLSEWGRNYRAVASIVKPLLPSLMLESGEGACAAGIAELLYEKNQLNDASMTVAAALSDENIEIAFAGYAQLALIARLDGTSARADEILATLGRLLEEKNATELMPTYRALCTRFDIHFGRLEKVRTWLDESTLVGLGDCRLSNVYELITRAQALIALSQCREAITLLESLLLLLRTDFRPLDTIECLAHSAVACELLGSRDLAMDKLEEALTLAEPYRYIRVIADCGRAMFQLLTQFAKDSARSGGISERYLSEVTEAAKTYSMLYPKLYSQESLPEDNAYTPDLTSTELQILQMISEGKTARAISEQLGIKPTTVKFHTANIFEKLAVTNRVEAVNAAKKFKIL